MSATTTTAELHPADDDEYWSQPPTGESGELPWVDLRLCLQKIGSVNTVVGTAFIKVSAVFYWTDPRLAGWARGHALPPALWGPRMELANASGDLIESDWVFTSTHAAGKHGTGRLKRGRCYTCTIDNPLQLDDFPLDVDVIRLNFFTGSHYQSLNRELSGSLSEGRSYRLRQICMAGEGEWMALFGGWTGEISEWYLHGVSAKIIEKEPGSNGWESTEVPIFFHVRRKASYYLWKVLLPLYLLTMLAMTTFHHKTDNISDRASLASTYFLAAFALLYVVGECLPKTDFLTGIDLVIVLTLVSIAFTGLASVALRDIHEARGVEMAERWNLILELGVCSLYTLGNLAIFLPALWRQRGKLLHLRQHEGLHEQVDLIDDESDDRNKERRNHSLASQAFTPACMNEGYDYSSLPFLRARSGRN